MIRRKRNHRHNLTDEQVNNLKGGVTFEEATDLLIRDCKLKNLRDDSINFYRNELNRSRIILEMQGIDTTPQKITTRIIKNNIIIYMRETERRSVTAVNCRLRALRRLFNFLKEEGEVEFSPIKEFDLLKNDKTTPIPLTEDQIKALLKQPNKRTFTGGRNLTIIMLLLETGIRLTELINLKVKDILWEDGLIRVSRTKNREERFVPFQAKMRKMLTEYLELRGQTKEERLFVNVNKTEMSSRRVQQVIKDYARKANLNDIQCTPHILRHTFVRFAVKSGANIFVVQDILGHKSLDMVRYYYKVYGEDLTTEHKKFSIAENIIK